MEAALQRPFKRADANRSKRAVSAAAHETRGKQTALVAAQPYRGKHAAPTQAAAAWAKPHTQAAPHSPTGVRVALVALVVIGALLRIAVCFVGYPHLLYSDELNIVEPALDLIQRNSYFCYAYFHPDHVQIKICALLFNAYSFIRFGTDAASMGAIADFYVIARLYGAVCGIATIPLAYAIGQRLKQGAGIWVALVFTFFPLFVARCGYASPDVPLVLVVLAVVYLSLRYLETGGLPTLIALGIVVAIGIVSKYNIAVLCLYGVALILLEGRPKHSTSTPSRNAASVTNALEGEGHAKRNGGTLTEHAKRSAGALMGRILLATLVVVAGAFCLAPNLFTDFGTVWPAVVNEARPNHVGADGLGFWGNLWFYLYSIFYTPHSVTNDIAYTNLEAIPLLIAGVACALFLVKDHRKLATVLLPSAFIWVSLSISGLHWLRWGLPMFAGPLILVGLGASTLWEFARTSFTASSAAPRQAWRIVLSVVALVLLAVSFANAITNCLVVTKAALEPQTRVVALEDLEESGINADQTASDGYSPFCLRDAAYARNSFTDATSLTPNDSNTAYVMVSSYMYGRFNLEDSSGSEDAAFYNALQQKATLVKRWDATPLDVGFTSVQNIASQLAYLAKPTDECLAGPSLALYQL